MATLAYPVDAQTTEAIPRTQISPLAVQPPSARVFVIPAYNEAENLPRLFAELEERPSLFTDGSRIILVDDGSEDATADLVRSYEGPLPIELLSLDSNQGPGAAFRAGFDRALTHCSDDALLVTLEADTTSDLDALPMMFARAADGAELVLASVHGGGRMLNVSAWRRLLSAGAGVVVRLALGLEARTVSSFFRVYRVSILRSAVERYGDDLIEEPGFACKAELLAKIAGLGARIDEVPVDLDGTKRVGESRMKVMPTLIGYWRLMRRGRTAKGPSAT
jgi:dolichol-phosphate mannosyltransferase